jgi:hypothetical protein
VKRAGLWALVALLGVGCARPAGSGAGAADTDSTADLASSLQVRVVGDSVRLDLFVTNSTASPIDLNFPSGQRYEFEIRTPEGARVWRWSAERMFTQALGTETLAAGGTLHHSATWAHGARRGRFIAEGSVPSTNHRVSRTTEFELP